MRTENCGSRWTIIGFMYFNSFQSQQLELHVQCGIRFSHQKYILAVKKKKNIEYHTYKLTFIFFKFFFFGRGIIFEEIFLHILLSF